MKKLKLACMAVLVAAITVLTGCDSNETALLTAANTAGNLGVSAWFALDNPDAEVKTALKDIVSRIDSTSSKVGAGESYLDALMPEIQKDIAAKDGLTVAQKNLLNAGTSVILSGIDVFIGDSTETRSNAEYVSRIVASFCRGCLTAIKRDESGYAANVLKRANKTTKMKYSKAANAFTAK